MSVMLAIALLPAAVFAASPEGVWSEYAADGFAAGTGTEEDPYQIATAEQLAYLAVRANEGTLHSLEDHDILTEDIDLSAHQWVPIGCGTSTDSKYFDGCFNGNGKTITGLYVDQSADKCLAGLFGLLTGQVSDLTIEAAHVKTAGSSPAGILAAKIFNSGTTVTNCHVSGTVESDVLAGGLAGYASYTSFTGCSANAEVVAAGNNIGGFIGEGFGTSFSDCTAEGSVRGSYSCGGFAGVIWADAKAERCIADVDVTASDWNTGGFVGFVERTVNISDCAALGDVSNPVTGTTTKLGGFAGSIDDTITIQNCYSTGVVTGGTGTHPAGGFVGYAESGTVTGCAFSEENNPGLNGVGEGAAGDTLTIDAANTGEVLDEVCAVFGHQESEPYTIEPTCTEPGSKNAVVCLRCSAVLRWESEIPALGHSWLEPDWSWSADGKTASATFICEFDNYQSTETATMTSAVKTESTCTENGVTTYTATVDFNSGTYTATNDVADIPATGHTYQDGKCTVCGAVDPDYEPATSDTASAPAAAPAPTIISGAGAVWNKGSGVGLTFTSNAGFAGFPGVMVDGTGISAEHYTAKAGSTVVALKASYLETLSVGSHTMAIVSDTGAAGAQFTVAAGTGVPQTGDNSAMPLWAALLLVSGAGLFGAVAYNKRKKYGK